MEWAASCEPVHGAGFTKVVSTPAYTSMAAAECLFVQALAEKESDGMAKMIYRKDTGEILGVHIFGLHAADLIHEASNAMATHQRVQVYILIEVCLTTALPYSVQCA